VVSDETLRANEASVDAYRESGALSEAQCLAQFSLGFSHLWRGEFDQAEVALSEALALAERIGDAANRVLCLTYLTVLYRKRGRTDEVSRYVELSRAACGDARMPAYAAVADANEAWLAGRQGDFSAAQVKAAAALEALQAWPLKYPLLWVALWPLVGAAAARGEMEQAVGHARAMLQEPQQLPPEPLRRDLETAIAAWDAGSVAVARKQLDCAIALAIGLGFL
jgi:eukaryotic-like serine/threonine-protein kinase